MFPIMIFGLVTTKKTELYKSALLSSLFFIFLLSPIFYEAFYRVMLIFIFFWFITGYGLEKIYTLINKKVFYDTFFKSVCIILCSLTILFIPTYSNRLQNIDALRTKANSHKVVLSKMMNKNKNIIIIEDKQNDIESDFFEKIGVFSTYYDSEDNIVPFKEYFPNICSATLKGRLKGKRVYQKLSKDNRVAFVPLENIQEMTADYYFTVSENAKKEIIKKLPKNYKYQTVDQYYTMFYKTKNI